jgi:hypothetical protein
MSSVGGERRHPLATSATLRLPGGALWAWLWWSPPSREAVDRFAAGCGSIPHLVPVARWGGTAAGENRALTSVMVNDGDVYAPLPC